MSVLLVGVIFRKWSPVLIHLRLLLTLSPISFSVIRFILKSLIHLNLNFVHVDRYGSILHVCIQLCQHKYWRCFLFFPFYNAGFFVKYQVFKHVWVNRVFNLISLFQCLFLCQYLAVFRALVELLIVSFCLVWYWLLACSIFLYYASVCCLSLLCLQDLYPEGVLDFVEGFFSI